MNVQTSRQNQNVAADTTLSGEAIASSARQDRNAQTKLGSPRSVSQAIGAPLALQSVQSVMLANSALIPLAFLLSVHMAQLRKQALQNASLAQKVLSVTPQMAQ
jgi:hypothetical protein